MRHRFGADFERGVAAKQAVGVPAVSEAIGQQAPCRELPTGGNRPRGIVSPGFHGVGSFDPPFFDMIAWCFVRLRSKGRSRKVPGES